MSDGISTAYFKKFVQALHPKMLSKLFTPECEHKTEDGQFPLVLHYVTGGQAFGAIRSHVDGVHYVSHGRCRLCHQDIPWEVVKDILPLYGEHRGKLFAGPADFIKDVLLTHLNEEDRQYLVSYISARSIANEIYGVFQ